MTRRIPLSQTFGRAIRCWWYGVRDDFGGPIRSLVERPRNAPRFVCEIPSIILGNVDEGIKIVDGRIRLGSQVLDIGTNGDPWSNAAPSQIYAERLHGFLWLEDAAALPSDKKLNKSAPRIAARAPERATYLVDRWIKEYGRWNRFAWRTDILANRIYAWLCQWSVLLNTDQDAHANTARRNALLRQVKRLRRVYKRMDSGIDKLRAAACLVMAGVCFQNQRGPLIDRALDWLDDEVEKQILLDGGHISRDPQTCVDALEILIYVESALEAAGLPGSTQIRRAIDRLTPTIAFFCAPDGGLFAFNGSGFGKAEKISKLLKLSKIKPKLFGYAPHTKYQRLDKNGSVIMLDIGATAPRPYDVKAHLAPLAMEMATNAGRLIVNCGWNIDQPSSWHDLVRTTPAHSTLILDNKPLGEIVHTGIARRLYGPAIKSGIDTVNYSRREEDNGVWLETSHSGYKKDYGLIHRRRIFMDVIGRDIRGEDSLLTSVEGSPLTRDLIGFDIRFHVHPSVKVTLAQDQNSALLIQPGKTGWQFKTDGGPLKLEKSVYLAEGSRPRRTEQIVISGQAYGDGDGQTRSNRVRWSFKRIGIIES